MVSFFAGHILVLRTKQKTFESKCYIYMYVYMYAVHICICLNKHVCVSHRQTTQSVLTIQPFVHLWALRSCYKYKLTNVMRHSVSKNLFTCPFNVTSRTFLHTTDSYHKSSNYKLHGWPRHWNQCLPNQWHFKNIEGF